MTPTHLDIERLQRLTHYICWICDDPRFLGPTRLHRILWYVERSLTLKRGRPLSGAGFVKRPSGPVCSALPHALAALREGGVLTIRPYSHTCDDEQYFANAEPVLDVFDGGEVSIIDSCIHGVCRDGFEIPRQQTHDSILQIARMGEEIPNYTAYAGAKAAIDDEDLGWAIKQLSRLSHEPDLVELDELCARDPRIIDSCSALRWYIERSPRDGLSLRDIRESFYYFKQKGMPWADIPDIGVLIEVSRDIAKPRAFQFTFPDMDEEDAFSPTFGRA